MTYLPFEIKMSDTMRYMNVLKLWNTNASISAAFAASLFMGTEKLPKDRLAVKIATYPQVVVQESREIILLSRLVP